MAIKWATGTLDYWELQSCGKYPSFFSLQWCSSEVSMAQYPRGSLEGQRPTPSSSSLLVKNLGQLLPCVSSPLPHPCLLRSPPTQTPCTQVLTSGSAFGSPHLGHQWTLEDLRRLMASLLDKKEPNILGTPKYQKRPLSIWMHASSPAPGAGNTSKWPVRTVCPALQDI